MNHFLTWQIEDRYTTELQRKEFLEENPGFPLTETQIKKILEEDLNQRRIAHLRTDCTDRALILAKFESRLSRLELPSKEEIQKFIRDKGLKYREAHLRTILREEKEQRDPTTHARQTVAEDFASYLDLDKIPTKEERTAYVAAHPECPYKDQDKLRIFLQNQLRIRRKRKL